MLDKSIKKLGKYIRSEIEIWIKGNPDIEEYNLLGACAIASFALYKSLIKLGHKPNFIMADSGSGAHCWVELQDYIIDLTATQFNMALPDVLITHKKYYFKAIPELKQYNFIKRNRLAISATKRWDQQNPIIYSKNINKLIRTLNVKDFI